MAKKKEPVPQPHRRPWKCPLCTNEYSTSGALDRHIAEAHPESH